MDQPQINPRDLAALSDSDKRELQQVLNGEMQKAKVQESVHGLTDLCWKKCVKGPIKSSQLDKNEEACTINCVGRFLDANDAVIQHLSKLQGR